MRIRVIGCGWYGAHISLALREQGHEVEVHESAARVFSGASGANPARLHEGFHYPRSRLTRAFCQDHKAQFMAAYGHLTRAVPVNLYAIAAGDSLVDFGTYQQVLENEVDFIPVHNPAEFGLQKVEGAVLTGERHIVIREARRFFTEQLGSSLHLNSEDGAAIRGEWDWLIDCTFCALGPIEVDRYEPCVTGLLQGPADRAVTIMDGPFPSVYPWDEAEGLSSITSAKHTPLARCETWDEARAVLDKLTDTGAKARVATMFAQMLEYWPDLQRHYKISGWKTGIRAMPRSAAAARIVDVAQVDARVIRVRAGKIDAVFQAQKLVEEILCSQ